MLGFPKKFMLPTTRNPVLLYTKDLRETLYLVGQTQSWSFETQSSFQKNFEALKSSFCTYLQ